LVAQEAVSLLYLTGTIPAITMAQVLDRVSKNERNPSGTGLSQRLAFLDPYNSNSMSSSRTVSTAASSTCPTITSTESEKSSNSEVSSSTGYAGEEDILAADHDASRKGRPMTTPKIRKTSKNAVSPDPQMSLGKMANDGTLKIGGTGSKKTVIRVRASSLSGNQPHVDIKHLEQVIKNYESDQKSDDDDSSATSGRRSGRSGRPSRPGRRVSAGQENRKRSVSRRRSMSRGRVNTVTEEEEDAAEEVTFAVKSPCNSPARSRRSKSRGRHEGPRSPTIQEILRPDDDSAPHRPRGHSRGRDNAGIEDVKERREDKQRSRSSGRPVTEKEPRKARSLSRPRPVREEKLDVDDHAVKDDCGVGVVKPAASNAFGCLPPTKQLKQILQVKKSGEIQLNSPSDDVTEKVLSTGIISREQLELLLAAGFRVSED
jgi:hypothetical protein